MTNWYPSVVKIAKYGSIKNSDSLDITQIYGENVIFKRGTYQTGDLAVFVPPESILPMNPDHPLLKDNPHLKPGGIVKAVRLRGVFSNGFLVPVKEIFTEAQLNNIPLETNIAELLGISKYEGEDAELDSRGECERDRGYMPKYTDIESWPKNRNKGYINPGDPVVVTLKVHGCSSRFTWKNIDQRLYCGSRAQIKASYDLDGDERNTWWRIAKQYNLTEKLKNLAEIFGHDNTVIYGEVYGQIQKGFMYDSDGKENKFRIFDTYDTSKNKYNNWNTTVEIAQILEIPTVPVLYQGPWNEELEILAEGLDPINPNHIREGFVIKPLEERYEYHIGRIIFKMVGQGYKLKDQKPEKKKNFRLGQALISSLTEAITHNPEEKLIEKEPSVPTKQVIPVASEVVLGC